MVLRLVEIVPVLSIGYFNLTTGLLKAVALSYVIFNGYLTRISGWKRFQIQWVAGLSPFFKGA